MNDDFVVIGFDVFLECLVEFYVVGWELWFVECCLVIFYCECELFVIYVIVVGDFEVDVYLFW